MIVEPSPFPYQGPLDPDQVGGREDLIAELTERLTSRRVTALLGPRRYGKTSVLRRVAADLAAAGTSIVWLDLYEITSIADLARRVDSGLSEAQGPVASVLRSVAASVDLNLGVLGVQLSRRPSERPDPEGVLDRLLDTMVLGATREPTIVIIDEFPGIDRVDGAAGLLRTKLQHHVQEIGLVFAGSQPSLMRALFTERSRPFYAQADLLEIGPLSPAEVDRIVNDGFSATGRRAGDLGSRIAEFSGGHPYRMMQAADAGWRLVPPGAAAGPTTWAEALELLRNETNLACEAIFSGLSNGEKSVLRLVAHGDALFGSAAELLDLSAGSARHAYNSLLAAGDLEERGGNRRIVDPVIADWVRRRFPR